VLTISGERQAPSAPEGENMVQRRSERGYGRFHRRFVLPDTVDADRVEAKDRNGMLEISIPKQAKALPRRIKVAA
jgi:HSP20 family protein